MPPNQMIQALQQSRASNPAPMPGGAPGGAPPGAPQPPQGDPGVAMAMQKMEGMLNDVTAKLDKLIEAISGQYKGTAEGSEPVEDEDGNDSGEAKTFK